MTQARTRRPGRDDGGGQIGPAGEPRQHADGKPADRDRNECAAQEALEAHALSSNGFPAAIMRAAAAVPFERDQ